jgi:hypothetical protein
MPLASSCGFVECDPNECREAEEGRTAYEPVIVAIEAYRTEHGSYPEGLGDLLPRYVESIPISLRKDGPGEPEYIRLDEGYEFSFRYFGPGINVCTYSPGKKWSCYGNY